MVRWGNCMCDLLSVLGRRAQLALVLVSAAWMTPVDARAGDSEPRDPAAPVPAPAAAAFDRLFPPGDYYVHHSVRRNSRFPADAVDPQAVVAAVRSHAAGGQVPSELVTAIENEARAVRTHLSSTRDFQDSVVWLLRDDRNWRVIADNGVMRTDHCSVDGRFMQVSDRLPDGHRAVVILDADQHSRYGPVSPVFEARWCLRELEAHGREDGAIRLATVPISGLSASDVADVRLPPLFSCLRSGQVEIRLGLEGLTSEVRTAGGEMVRRASFQAAAGGRVIRVSVERWVPTQSASVETESWTVDRFDARAAGAAIWGPGFIDRVRVVDQRKASVGGGIALFEKGGPPPDPALREVLGAAAARDQGDRTRIAGLGAALILAGFAIGTWVRQRANRRIGGVHAKA